MDKLEIGHHINHQFDEDMKLLKGHLLELGDTVLKQLTDGLMALKTNDNEHAVKVLASRNEVHMLEAKIEKACEVVIATRQPTAGDLRFIMAVTRCTHDLERIGAKAKKLAKIVLKQTSKDPSLLAFDSIQEFGFRVQEMLRQAMQAFETFDTDLALKILSEDEALSKDFDTLVLELMQKITAAPQTISRMLDVFSLLQAIKRVGDHAENICEQVVYMVKGKDISHQSYIDAQ